MTSSIVLCTENHTGEVDPRIFSGFLEHLGRAVYDGVYDPGNPRSDASGFRTDVLDALRAMGMPFVRYPGGNFVSNYDWKDGVGPRSKRPRRADFAWKTLEPNSFGTNEFVSWCRALGTEPMLAVNLGTGTPKSAAELVEYCNFASGTQWSDLRRSHGYAEPHRVQLWCLGNEMDGPWQAGHVSAAEYGSRARQAAALMKGLDPSIELVLAGSSGRQLPTYLEWDRVVLEQCWDHVDYISAHRYSRNEDDDTPWFLAEGLEIDRILEDYAGLLSYVRGLRRSPKSVYLSFDEWNVWYKSRAQRNGEWTEAPHLIEEVYNLEDALVCAQYLNSFIRRADLVKIACLAQIVNVIAPILTNRDGMLLQATYWPVVAYAQHARGLSLRPSVNAPVYSVGDREEVPVIDASATFDPESGHISLFVVNRDVARAQTLSVAIHDRAVTGFEGGEVLTGTDPKAANSWESPNLIKPAPAPSPALESGTATVTLPALAFGRFSFATAPR